MSGRKLLQAAYFANLACREAEGRAAPNGDDEFARQTSLLKEQALQVIRQLPDPAQREVLEKRYLESLPFDEIAAEMHYSRRRLFELHKAAMEAIDSLS